MHYLIILTAVTLLAGNSLPGNNSEKNTLDTNILNSEKAESTNDTTKTSITGERLFRQNCAHCHTTSDRELIGPGLKGVTRKYSNKWLKKWIYDAEAMKRDGDKKALLIDKKYAGNQPSLNYLTQKEINLIIEYLETLN